MIQIIQNNILGQVLLNATSFCCFLIFRNVLFIAGFINSSNWPMREDNFVKQPIKSCFLADIYSVTVSDYVFRFHCALLLPSCILYNMYSIHYTYEKIV